MTPFVIVIFGATGDLAKRKLFPALFSLYEKGQLGEQFYIIGFARREFSDDAFREMVGEHFLGDTAKKEAFQNFAKNLYYQQGLFDEESGYTALIERLNTFDQQVGACITRLFYLATPPDNYQPILQFLDGTKLSEGCGQGSNKWTRLAIEKPFGKDLESAKALDMQLAKLFAEEQIFRVDHYLAKETIQNTLAFRFANGIFDPVWNNKYIDHVQITLSEKNGIGHRGKFFDGVGNLRDVGQNHLLQLLTAVTMEQPSSFSKEGVRDARAKAMEAIECVEGDAVVSNVVRGQYASYHDEKNVDPDSETETYVAMKLKVNTPRFEGVPFYLRAGKKMEKDSVEISLVFIQTCHLLFKEYGCPEIGNVLTIRVQPNEGINIRLIAKKPGAKVTLDTVDMHFSYKEQFGYSGVEAYEKLLTDILIGDQMLFNRSDELESSWKFITNILTAWQEKNPPLHVYEDNSSGPKEASDLIEKDNRKWL
ncbi:MAG: glucose-6-phosphate dehydrogenase [Candidatus Levybacteria bacterium]|nr:glucose-6-phosphate dehydrogenase [Candidatus Levybacteria bacterium]